MEENKKEGLKYILFIGIPVIIILGVLGAYYYATNPITILSKTINELYHHVDKLEITEIDKEAIEKPFLIKANAEFHTDLEELQEIQKYNYHFELGIDYQKEYAKLLMGMKDQDQDIIETTFFQLNNKQYLKSEKILDSILEINENVPWEDMFDMEALKNNKTNINVEQFKEITKEIKDIFLKSLDKKYMKREKKDITIFEESIKTTKITYDLNKENIEYTKTFMVNQIKKDKKLLQKITSFTNKSEEEIIKSLEEWKNETIEEEYQIELYTEGIKQNVIEGKIKDTNDTLLTYTNYKDQTTLNIKNEVLLTMNQWDKYEIDFNYEIIKEQIKGSVKLKADTANNQSKIYNILLSINSKDFNGELKLDLEILQKQLELPNLENVKKAQELTGSEIQTILENIEKAIQNTYLYDLLDKNIM